MRVVGRSRNTHGEHELSVTYSHQTLATQPLLAIPDVIAWCWARGGHWRRRVMPVIADVTQV
jgi:hypothetical protein